MTGNQILAAYVEIVRNDLYPVLGITDTGVDETIGLMYVNLGVREVGRRLRREAAASFSTLDGVQDYGLETATARRFFELRKVLVNGRCLERVELDDEREGYAVEGSTLTFTRAYAAGATVRWVGCVYPAPIVASDVEVSDVAPELHLAVAQFGVLAGCGSQEVTNDQRSRLEAMQRMAEEAVLRERNRVAMMSFPASLRDGTR